MKEPGGNNKTYYLLFSINRIKKINHAKNKNCLVLTDVWQSVSHAFLNFRFELLGSWERSKS
jgi:hypothetical protein